MLQPDRLKTEDAKRCHLKPFHGRFGQGIGHIEIERNDDLIVEQDLLRLQVELGSFRDVLLGRRLEQKIVVGAVAVVDVVVGPPGTEASGGPIRCRANLTQGMVTTLLLLELMFVYGEAVMAPPLYQLVVHLSPV